MKNRIYLMSLLILVSCNDAMEFYGSTENKIGFVFYKGQDSTLRKSFMYDATDIDVDTLYVTLRTMGFVTDFDREVTLRQVDVEGKNNAVLNTHYADFTGTSTIPAGKATVEIPIVVFRDATLKEDDYLLRLEIVENNNFLILDSLTRVKDVVISDILSRPTKWHDKFALGVYGKVKHQFLIDKTEFKWDNDYLSLMEADYAYLFFMKDLANELLDIENKRRASLAPPLGPLRERPTAENPDGILVEF